MKINKAAKTLEQKGTGVILKIKEMELNYNPEKYFNEVQTYGYLLRYLHGKPFLSSFKMVGCGEPYQYIDFMASKEIIFEDVDTTVEWGYYSFEQISTKFGGLPLHFGMNDVVHKSTENRLDIYYVGG